jgi:3-hydroxybutyrate dehydrogenase
MTTLSGKTALVTGSTSGIGLGIALSLAKAGANLILNGFGDASKVIAEVGQFGGKVGHHPADVSDPAQIADMIAYAEREFGGVDILVNNAGIQHVAAVEEFPVERWDSIIAINLSSVFHSTRLSLPRMRTKGWGRIINIASVHGQVGSTGKAAYVAAKHGVIGLTKVVGLETATSNVTCNAICPGWVLTPLVQKQIDDRAKASGKSVREEEIALLAEKQPMHQFTKPESIGALTVFLCSDAAATITGSAYSIDGGWVAQ